VIAALGFLLATFCLPVFFVYKFKKIQVSALILLTDSEFLKDGDHGDLLVPSFYRPRLTTHPGHRHHRHHHPPHCLTGTSVGNRKTLVQVF
jgi:hypothetical protein